MSDGSTPLHLAAVGGCYNITKTLLKNYADINIKDLKGRTSLEKAVAHGHIEIVKILLQHDSSQINSKNSDDWTLLHIAAGNGFLNITK